MNTLHLPRVLLIGLATLLPVAARAQQEETEPAGASQLTAVALPKGTVRMRRVPDGMKQTLATLIAAGGKKVRQGDSEVLAWTGAGYKKAQAPQLMASVKSALEKSAWKIETQDSGQGFLLLSAIQEKPAPRAVLGVWVPADEALILAWTEMLPNAGAADAPDETAEAAAPQSAATQQDAAPAAPANAMVLTVDANTKVLNVMKNAMPKIPTFPTVQPKPGFVRGYVQDLKGKPLQNAKLGVRSTAVGGAYSGAQGKTDAQGYYEIAVPFGVAHFYNAGYSIDYGEGRAALGLHPADGELDGFASNVGGVENFVLLPYGIANRDDVQDDPHYAGNYYGGAVSLSYSVSDEGTDLPPNSEIEFTLKPQAPLIDGSQGRTIIIHKRVGTWFGQLYIVNIPITTYGVTANLVGGGALRIKETGPNGGAAFGIEPKEAVGAVALQLRPGTAKAEMALPAHGNWDSISLSLYR
jgi:hypothetical protein